MVTTMSQKRRQLNVHIGTISMTKWFLIMRTWHHIYWMNAYYL